MSVIKATIKQRGDVRTHRYNAVLTQTVDKLSCGQHTANLQTPIKNCGVTDQPRIPGYTITVKRGEMVQLTHVFVGTHQRSQTCMRSQEVMSMDLTSGDTKDSTQQVGVAVAVGVLAGIER